MMLRVSSVYFCYLQFNIKEHKTIIRFNLFILSQKGTSVGYTLPAAGVILVLVLFELTKHTKKIIFNNARRALLHPHCQGSSSIQHGYNIVKCLCGSDLTLSFCFFSLSLLSLNFLLPHLSLVTNLQAQL